MSYLTFGMLMLPMVLVAPEISVGRVTTNFDCLRYPVSSFCQMLVASDSGWFARSDHL